MFNRTMPGKRQLAWVIMSATMALTLASSGALASPKCSRVSGKFTLQTVSGPACLSPVGLCAIGSYQGDIRGTSDFTGTNLVPSVDTPTTSVVFLTGDNLIHTDQGELLTKDAIVLRTSGAGDFAEVDTVIGGTGNFQRATGSLSAVGTFTTEGGQGRYTGEICRP